MRTRQETGQFTTFVFIICDMLCPTLCTVVFEYRCLDLYVAIKFWYGSHLWNKFTFHYMATAKKFIYIYTYMCVCACTCVDHECVKTVWIHHAPCHIVVELVLILLSWLLSATSDGSNNWYRHMKFDIFDICCDVYKPSASPRVATWLMEKYIRDLPG